MSPHIWFVHLKLLNLKRSIIEELVDFYTGSYYKAAVKSYIVMVGLLFLLAIVLYMIRVFSRLFLTINFGVSIK